MKIPNYKYQIPNNFKIAIFKIQNCFVRQLADLNFGYCNLFVICYLKFVIFLYYRYPLGT